MPWKSATWGALGPLPVSPSSLLWGLSVLAAFQLPPVGQQQGGRTLFRPGAPLGNAGTAAVAAFGWEPYEVGYLRLA